ncbi:MAG: ion transporter [Chloroflexi bacterium]|nr:ion transporter [Chloroflexota bacterium]
MTSQVYDFFEHPHTLAAKLVRGAIFSLILGSVAFLTIEFSFPEVFHRYSEFFRWAEYGILGTFTLEYLLRFTTAPRKWNFVRQPYNIIDLVAIVPGLLALALPLFLNTSEVRILRLLRLVRFSRIMRSLRLLRFEFFGKVFQLNNTILQAIAPIILFFLVLKGVIWMVEYFGFWFSEASLGELFAVIGFALGIVLSQKVAASYEKFLQMHESQVQIAGILSSLAVFLNQFEPGQGTRLTRTWAQAFLEALQQGHTQSSTLAVASQELYNTIAAQQPHPAYLGSAYLDLMKTSRYTMFKRNYLTPRPYDSLLQQSTVLYIFMLALFVPGWVGLVSVAVATYVLYGMYHLTQDLDSLMGGEFRLITVSFTDLQAIAAGTDVQSAVRGPEDDYPVPAERHREPEGMARTG